MLGTFCWLVIGAAGSGIGITCSFVSVAIGGLGIGIYGILDAVAIGGLGIGTMYCFVGYRFGNGVLSVNGVQLVFLFDQVLMF